MQRIYQIPALLLLLAKSFAADPFSCGVMALQPDRELLVQQPTVSSLGVQKLIFYRVRFPDDKSDPITQQKAEDTLTEANAIFARMSRGKFGIESTITPVLHLNKSRESYGDAGGFSRFIDDVRAAGALAGFNYLDYDLDIARHSGVPGFMGGNANLGTRGAQVQADGAVVIVHELGHNLGFNHANSWVTGSPGLSNGSPPLPSNFPGTPDPRSIPVYPDSFLGHESIIGPGFSAEYGDTFDVMGSGTLEFNMAYQYLAGWLEQSDISLASPGLTLHTIQTGVGDAAGLPRAIRIESPLNTPLGEYEYWIQIPIIDTNTTTDFPGVQVRWVDASANRSSSQILAPAASVPSVNSGVILAPGKSFSDLPNGVIITLLGVNDQNEDRTAQVAVYVGDTSSNHPPTVSITTEPIDIDVNQPFTLNATASDPDGDALVWHWDFGDGFTSTTATNVVKSWRRSGDFLVYLEVSDQKGGVARSRVPVRVGAPATLRISGRILTAEGQPVRGARVHNGLTNSGTSTKRALLTFTDSNGAYTLTGVLPGTYDMGAFLFGYAMDRRAPVQVTNQNLENIDFSAVEIPHISVAAPAEISEDAGLTNLFVLTRSGSLSDPVTVLYRLGGTTTSGRDYVRPFIDRVTIPAGASNAVLSLSIQDDSSGETLETIRLDVSYPVQAQRLDSAGHPYTVYFPGWDLATIAGVTNWVLTDPSYIPGPNASATVLLRDNDTASPVNVSIVANSLVAIETPRVDGGFLVTRTGGLDRALTVFFETAGGAQNGIDYVGIENTVTFQAGEAERTIVIQPIEDQIAEPEEQATINILASTEYGVEAGTATVALRDNAQVPQTLAAILRVDGNLQLTLRARPASRLVLEASSDFVYWTPIRTNFLFNSDTAVVTLPVAVTNAFFRTVITAN